MATITPAWNPLGHLGTLGWFFYWIVIVSGIYLYIFFDTGINQAYESLEYITNVQWYAGGGFPLVISSVPGQITTRKTTAPLIIFRCG